MDNQIFVTSSLSVNKSLSIPIGVNATNESTRSRVPSFGALSYDQGASLLYFGDSTDWVEVAGPQGATGSATVGPTGPTGFLPYGNASWTLVNSQGNVTLISTQGVAWNLFQTGGNVISSPAGLTVPIAGSYLVNFGYGLNLPSSGQNVPQSLSLCVNNNVVGISAQYTLQERSDLTPSPALYTSNKGQSATVLLALSAGDTVNLINSTINDLHFQNNVDGTYTINGGIGSLAAWITLHAI